MPKRRTGPDRPAPTTGAACPCGTGHTYGACCGALHSGQGSAPTAERLMRSRYSAFAVGDTAYLLRTWHPSTRPPSVEADPRTRWRGLEIVSTTGGTAFHTEGTVDFRARYAEGGREDELREHSRFVRHDGAWTYLDAAGG